MWKTSPLARAGLLAFVFTAGVFAQAMVGYGVMTGTTATTPAAAGKAAADRLSKVGSRVRQSGGSAPRPAGLHETSAAAGQSSSVAPESVSIVLRAKWGSVETVADPDSHEAPVNGDDPILAAGAPVSSAAPKPRPESLRRGASIDDLIAEIGKPSLVVHNVTGVGYDRKYVFASNAETRYAVLVLGPLIVNWERQQ